MINNVHVIDDDPIVLLSLEAVLDCAGFTVRTYESASAFLTSANPRDAGCIVADVDMPGLDGLELKRLLVESGVECPVIVISGRPNSGMLAEAAASGASECCRKPIAASAIITGVRKACSANA